MNVFLMVVLNPTVKCNVICVSEQNIKMLLQYVHHLGVRNFFFI